MICTLTARRLKPGSYDEFRAAWDPQVAGGPMPHGWTEIFHARDVDNPDVVLSFGLFDGNVEQLREAQAEMSRDAQLDRVGVHVDAVLLDGSFEVVEHITS
jgi:hypothetical protein